MISYLLTVTMVALKMMISIHVPGRSPTLSITYRQTSCALAIGQLLGFCEIQSSIKIISKPMMLLSEFHPIGKNIWVTYCSKQEKDNCVPVRNLLPSPTEGVICWFGSDDAGEVVDCFNFCSWSNWSCNALSFVNDFILSCNCCNSSKALSSASRCCEACTAMSCGEGGQHCQEQKA